MPGLYSDKRKFGDYCTPGYHGTRIAASLGFLIGLGFGIYGAVESFDPTAHQPASMSPSTQNFYEGAQQTITAIEFACLFVLAGALIGIALDLLVCRWQPCSVPLEVIEEEEQQERERQIGLITGNFGYQGRV